MKAAVVLAPSAVPVLDTFAEPAVGPDEALVHVLAAGLHPLVRSVASGDHYTADQVFPRIVGVDGVGLVDGRRCYFGVFTAPWGTMAERASTKLRVPVPDDVSDVLAAAIVNPGMSAWISLRSRAAVQPGDTVLVLGATGAGGGLAVQLAKRFGAGRIIAVGRNVQRLERLRGLGADAVVRLEGSRAELQRAIALAAGKDGIDVVIDYVWGEPAEAAIAAVASLAGGSFDRAGRRVRYVQVGALAGADARVPAEALRSADFTLLGSGAGSVSMRTFLAAIQEILAIAKDLKIDVVELPLAEIGAACVRGDGERRIVLRH